MVLLGVPMAKGWSEQHGDRESFNIHKVEGMDRSSHMLIRCYSDANADRICFFSNHSIVFKKLLGHNSRCNFQFSTVALSQSKNKHDTAITMRKNTMTHGEIIKMHLPHQSA